MGKKIVRVIATVMVEFLTDLDVEDAVEELQNNTDYSFGDTDNVKVIETDLREMKSVSVMSNI